MNKRLLNLLSIVLGSICVIFILSMFGCTSSESIINPNAKDISQKTTIDGVEFRIISCFESRGSDYAAPAKNHVFTVVKVEIKNSSTSRINVSRGDFILVVDGNEIEPINQRLNFILDPFGEDVTIEANSSYTAKLVWVTPKKYRTRVLVFKPAFSDETVYYNL